MKVLAVDDNPMTGIILSDKLAAMGFEPRTAPDAASALAIVEQESPEIIVLDWMMPGTDGLELTCSIRKHPAGASAYIIMLSGKSEEDSLALAYSMGVNDFVRKPVAHGELDARLDAARRFVQMRECLSEARAELQKRREELAGLLARVDRRKEAA